MLKKTLKFKCNLTLQKMGKAACGPTANTLVRNGVSFSPAKNSSVAASIGNRIQYECWFGSTSEPGSL